MKNSDHTAYIWENFVEDNNSAHLLSQQGKFSESKPYIDRAVNFIAGLISCNISFSNFTAKDYAKVFGMAGFIYGELGDDDAALCYYQHYQFLKTQLKHSFQDRNHVKLFQFRSNKPHTIENLEKNRITLASPREQNDIVDSPIFAWLDFILGQNERYTKHIDSLKRSFDGYKIASFCQDSKDKRAIENTLMWAHYADSHRGFCIEYHIDSSDFRRDSKSKLFAARLFEVDYLPEENNVLAMSDSNTVLNSKTAFFTKSHDWNYENEVRMVSYSPVNSEKYPPFELGSKSRISAIYFGVNCPDETILAVRNALTGRDVKYFKMEINPNNIYTLKEREII